MRIWLALRHTWRYMLPWIRYHTQFLQNNKSLVLVFIGAQHRCANLLSPGRDLSQACPHTSRRTRYFSANSVWSLPSLDTRFSHRCWWPSRENSPRGRCARRVNEQLRYRQSRGKQRRLRPSIPSASYTRHDKPSHRDLGQNFETQVHAKSYKKADINFGNISWHQLWDNKLTSNLGSRAYINFTMPATDLKLYHIFFNNTRTYCSRIWALIISPVFC